MILGLYVMIDTYTVQQWIDCRLSNTAVSQLVLPLLNNTRFYLLFSYQIF